jgi:hypothetical protein
MNPVYSKNLNATRIGILAKEALASDRGGRIMGVTSSGVFLRINDSIIFLTKLPYKSPYNLQVLGLDRVSQDLHPGDEFQVADGRITFQGSEIEVATNRAEVWVPGKPHPYQSDVNRQLNIVASLLRQIQSMEGDKGYLFLTGIQNASLNVVQEPIKTASTRLLRSFRKQDLVGISISIETLLGNGGGLTPSGDDFLSGFFLYHVRLSQAQNTQPGFALIALDEVIRRAREKTTTISVNRLQAARSGWAEDVFLSLIDHLFAPDQVPLPDNLPHILLNFGHSSGVDTLVGIYFAISSTYTE